MSMLWQALAIDDQCNNSWNGLGNAGGGVVGDTQYSQKQCHQQVLCRGWHGGRRDILGHAHVAIRGGPGMGAGRLGHVASSRVHEGRGHRCAGRAEVRAGAFRGITCTGTDDNQSGW